MTRPVFTTKARVNLSLASRTVTLLHGCSPVLMQEGHFDFV